MKDPMGDWLQAWREYLDGTRAYEDIPRMPTVVDRLEVVQGELAPAERAGLTVLLPTPRRPTRRERLRRWWLWVKFKLG